MKRPADIQRLIELLEPPVQALGFELIDVETQMGRRGLLRLYIDREPAVTLADCELVSGQVGAFLDVEDPLPGSYLLEVSSPGLDRRLRTAAHFQRFLGAEVRVQLRQARDGRRRFRGRLTEVQGSAITIESDGEKWTMRLEEIDVARLVPQI